MIEKLIERLSAFFREPASFIEACRFLRHEAKETADALARGVCASYRDLDKAKTDERLYRYGEDYLPAIYLIQQLRAALEAVRTDERERVFVDALGAQYEIVLMKCDKRNIRAVVRQL